ncbi:MAG: hypothetical protein IKT40_09480 [Bacilli bacterium]|nr:hypothetical protein [Bacilli bacterium]
MKHFLEFILSFIISFLIAVSVFVYIDNRELKKDIKHLIHNDSTIVIKLKEVVDGHNSIVDHIQKQDTIILSLIKKK